MPRRSLTAFLALAALTSGALLSAPPASRAASPSASPSAAVQVENAWVPQPPPGAEVAAAYFTLRNTGRAPAVLVGISSSVATSAMLHRTMVTGGESMMRPVERLSIPPGQAVRLKPEGLHVMLTGLRKPLQVGEEVPLVLRFASGDEIHVSARVRPLGSQ